MKYLVKRIGYDAYVAAYSEGGGLYENFKAAGRELPTPLTEDEWVAEQGSIEGPILSVREIADGVEVKVPDGYSVMDEESYELQISIQQELADAVSQGGELNTAEGVPSPGGKGEGLELFIK